MVRLLAAGVVLALGAQPMTAAAAVPLECTDSAPVVCTYDVPPGDYDVKVVFGREHEPVDVVAEARRYAGLVAAELARLGLVGDRYWN